MAPLNFNSHISHSFPPLIYEDVEILILGSLPGKKSIELKNIMVILAIECGKYYVL